MNLVVNERSSLNNNNRTLGLLPDYAENENWSKLCGKDGVFFIANETETENKKKAILLSCCGVVTYCLFKSLVAPKNPGDIHCTKNEVFH